MLQALNAKYLPFYLLSIKHLHLLTPEKLLSHIIPYPRKGTTMEGNARRRWITYHNNTILLINSSGVRKLLLPGPIGTESEISVSGCLLLKRHLKRIRSSEMRRHLNKKLKSHSVSICFLNMKWNYKLSSPTHTQMFYEKDATCSFLEKSFHSVLFHHQPTTTTRGWPLWPENVMEGRVTFPNCTPFINFLSVHVMSTSSSSYAYSSCNPRWISNLYKIPWACSIPWVILTTDGGVYYILY